MFRLARLLHLTTLMSFTNEKSRQWRHLHHQKIQEWRERIQELGRWANLERWTYERFDMELGQLLDQDLREIWFFAGFYVSRTKAGSLRKTFVDAIREIREYGTIEPSLKKRLLRAIQATKRKLLK